MNPGFVITVTTETTGEGEEAVEAKIVGYLTLMVAPWHRVSHLVVDLGWVDYFGLGFSPSCPAASATFALAQAESGRQWNTQIQGDFPHYKAKYYPSTVDRVLLQRTNLR